MKLSEIKKCCFCVPVRKGVITFGYINLVLCLLSLPLLILLITAKQHLGDEVENGNMLADIHTPLPLAVAFILVDIIIVIILLIGAHKKKRNLLRVYFYSGVLLQLITLIVDLVYFDYTDYILNIAYVIGLVINIYQLFLVYNLVHFMKKTRDVQYIPHIENQAIV